jgi:hypothetical protein
VDALAVELLKHYFLWPSSQIPHVLLQTWILFGGEAILVSFNILILNLPR